MANYEIGDASTRSARSPKMSAFPRHVRPFTEAVSATEDAVIGPGYTLPDLIRFYYPGAKPHAFSGNFGFLTRDNKVRHYTPGDADPFVFRSTADLARFSDEAIKLIEQMCDKWEAMGLPLIFDKDRQIKLPDTAYVWEHFSSPDDVGERIRDHIKDIYVIVSNADIAKKACVVRTVNPGWWAVSYKGKTSIDKSFFSTSLRAHFAAIKRILLSSTGKATYQQIWAESSDPIDTNPGYPFYTAEMSSDGKPITRIKTINLFKNLMTDVRSKWQRERKNGNEEATPWGTLLREVDERAGKYGMRGHPFCVAPLRRQQPGYKWNHMFTTTPGGLVTAFDERGINSQRVAWMVPYVYNLLLTPIQCAFKAIRMLLPGLYHDGPSKIRRTSLLKESAKSNKLWLAEADYSNYDRFIPVDIIKDLTDHVIYSLEQLEPFDREFFREGSLYLHEAASLAWPDYNTRDDPQGWLFKPGVLGLMSGVKVTSEIGTLVNSVINAEVLRRTKGWDENALTSYLCQYLDGSPPGSKEEMYHIQSDDTLFIASDPITLKKQGDYFLVAVKAAGLKGSLELGDRFLMRHTFAGLDLPVPLRVWQNTLSNETPVEDEMIFLAGLAARTDGLFGYKSVDPFGTGRDNVYCDTYNTLSLNVSTSLSSFISSARTKSVTALDLLKKIVSTRTGNGLLDGGTTQKLDSLRQAIVAALAEAEINKRRTFDKDAIGAWIRSLMHDQFSPSSAQVLDELRSLSGSISQIADESVRHEVAFFKYACSEIGIAPLKL